MKWRPKDWENHYNFSTGGAIPNYEKQSQAFESGADEMLEGLFQMARESPTGTFTIDVREQNIYMENNNKKK